MKKFFIYTSEDGFTYFDSEAKQLKNANEIIQSFLDDGYWDPDVKMVLCGTVTHIVEEVDFKTRPADLDEEECDGEGVYWGDWEATCDYKLKKFGDE